MAEIILINENYVKQYTNVNGAVDANRIYQAVSVAQDLHLEQYLGTDLLNKIKTDVNAETITGAYSTLYESYIKKALLWFTMIELIPAMYYRHDNGSLVKRTSEDAELISQGELDRLIDDARGKAILYTQKMVDYLCANSASFPEYSSNTFPDKHPVKNVQGRSKMVFSSGNSPSSRNTSYIYNDERYCFRY